MIVEISVVPIGVGESLSLYIAEALKIIEKEFENYRITPMGTVVEVENFASLGNVLDKITEKLVTMGVPRVYFVVKSDYRVKKTTMDYKVEKVKSILKK